jgi:amino acid permease
VTGGQKYGFTYWNDPGAFTPEKSHILNAIVLASLTMQGTEIVGVTAAEADRPSKVSECAYDEHVSDNSNTPM